MVTATLIHGRSFPQGPTARDIAGGGIIEHHAGAQYRIWQERLSLTCPRTGALLGRVAEQYELRAHDLDNDDPTHH